MKIRARWVLAALAVALAGVRTAPVAGGCDPNSVAAGPHCVCKPATVCAGSKCSHAHQIIDGKEGAVGRSGYVSTGEKACSDCVCGPGGSAAASGPGRNPVKAPRIPWPLSRATRTTRCTVDAAEAHAVHFMGSGGTAASNCPENSNFPDFFAQMPAAVDSFVALTIGCNKAFDVIDMAALATSEPRFSRTAWKGATGFPSKSFSCNNENRAPADSARHRHVAVGGYRHHCVEPVQKNYDMVKAGVDKLNFSDAIVVSQAAITISSDPPMVQMALPIPAKIGMVGIEGLSIDPTRAEGPAVPALSVDEYVEQQSIEQLDALMIDAEGWDAKVLFGATKTLGSLQPPYMEFEVHSKAPWSGQDLREVIDYLDGLEYDCYFAGNSPDYRLHGATPSKQRPGGLWKITGCWNPVFAVKRWSNVQCHHRASAAWQQVFSKQAAWTLQQRPGRLRWAPLCDLHRKTAQLRSIGPAFTNAEIEMASKNLGIGRSSSGVLRDGTDTGRCSG